MDEIDSDRQELKTSNLNLQQEISKLQNSVSSLTSPSLSSKCLQTELTSSNISSLQSDLATKDNKSQ